MRAVATALAIVVAAGLGGGVVASATHAEDTAAQTSASDSPKPDKSKKICRTIVTTGTRFSQRHCRSKEDWDKDAEISQRYLEESQMYGSRRDGELSPDVTGANAQPR